jgi:hypothetical protein
LDRGQVVGLLQELELSMQMLDECRSRR